MGEDPAAFRAALPVNVLRSTLSVAQLLSLLIAPPDVPVAAGDWLPENVTPETCTVPRLKIAPPPLVPLSAKPLLRTRP